MLRRLKRIWFTIAATDDAERQVRRRRRGLLRMYYGVDDHASSGKAENPLDIDCSGFKPDHYMEKMLKEASLGQLFEMERKLKKGGISKYGFVAPLNALFVICIVCCQQRLSSLTATCSTWFTRTTPSSLQPRRQSRKSVYLRVHLCAGKSACTYSGKCVCVHVCGGKSV